jgi:hypothetical protein
LIAQLSVETGIPQRELWRQSAADTRALIDAVNERNTKRGEIDRWTITHELLAQVIDTLSVRRVEAWRQAGTKSSLPKPYRVPRPNESDKQEVVVVSPGEAARMMLAG